MIVTTTMISAVRYAPRVIPNARVREYRVKCFEIRLLLDDIAGTSYDVKNTLRDISDELVEVYERVCPHCHGNAGATVYGDFTWAETVKGLVAGWKVSELRKKRSELKHSSLNQLYIDSYKDEVRYFEVSAQIDEAEGRCPKASVAKARAAKLGLNIMKDLNLLGWRDYKHAEARLHMIEALCSRDEPDEGSVSKGTFVTGDMVDMFTGSGVKRSLLVKGSMCTRAQYALREAENPPEQEAKLDSECYLQQGYDIGRDEYLIEFDDRHDYDVCENIGWVRYALLQGWKVGEPIKYFAETVPYRHGQQLAWEMKNAKGLEKYETEFLEGMVQCAKNRGKQFDARDYPRLLEAAAIRSRKNVAKFDAELDNLKRAISGKDVLDEPPIDYVAKCESLLAYIKEHGGARGAHASYDMKVDFWRFRSIYKSVRNIRQASELDIDEATEFVVDVYEKAQAAEACIARELVAKAFSACLEP